MILTRRNVLIGLGAAIAAPAIIRTPGLLMPIKSFILPVGSGLLVPTGKRDPIDNSELYQLMEGGLPKGPPMRLALHTRGIAFSR